MKWNIPTVLSTEAASTQTIKDAMANLCEEIQTVTAGKITASFKEEGYNNSPILGDVYKDYREVFSSVKDFANAANMRAAETLPDASGLYNNQRYEFEIRSKKYRFRAFELEMRPLYPVLMTVDEVIAEEEWEKLIRTARTSNSDKNCFTIRNDEEFESVVNVILNSKKMMYLLERLQQD